MQREIVGCIGGGANHLRWLLLVDPVFVYFKHTATDNFTFITNYVYPQDRNWQNWLHWEWRWRVLVNDAIALSHDCDINSSKKYCALTTEPDDALKHYLKFNSNLNNRPIQDFKHKISEYNKKVNSQKHCDNLIIVNGSSLFKETLDQTLYATLIDWFELNDNYNQAAEVHSLWWNLIKRAEKEIVRDLQNMYT